MNKVIFSLIVVIASVFSVKAEIDRTLFYNAFISGDMVKWKNAMISIENKSLSISDKLDLVVCYYGYIGYSLGVKNKKEAQIYIDKGDKLLGELEKNDPANATVYALKAAFVGFKIAMSPLKAPFIGKSSNDNVKKALMLDNNNIQANIEQANILYYSPAAFGGDKNEAKTYYQKAVSLFERNSSDLYHNWPYLNLLTQIAQIQVSEKKYNEAKKTYEKILEIEPDYMYVKTELLPALKNKM